MPLGLTFITATTAAPAAGFTFSGQGGLTPTTVGDFIFVLLSWWNATGTASYHRDFLHRYAKQHMDSNRHHAVHWKCSCRCGGI